MSKKTKKRSAVSKKVLKARASANDALIAKAAKADADMAREQLIDKIVAEVRNELVRATRKFGKFNSAHEGYAVIAEELDELWDEVKRRKKRAKAMRVEAIQVAAMGARFVLDVVGK